MAEGSLDSGLALLIAGAQSGTTKGNQGIDAGGEKQGNAWFCSNYSDELVSAVKVSVCVVVDCILRLVPMCWPNVRLGVLIPCLLG